MRKFIPHLSSLKRGKMKSIIIAAPQSGSGKTTIALGLMECLKRRGLRVAPFKVGPDFIDPGYHRLVTGRPSVNLDGWMCGADFVGKTFAHHARFADIAVIEGVMGLYDGVGGVQEEGSTAEVAKITGSPVILVVDAKSQARSVAALVKGFAEFDRDVQVAGVIFNNIGSENHGRVLREAVEASCCGVKVLGCVPRDDRLHIPSRHLGLLTVEENPLPGEFLDHLAGVIRENIDLGLVWAAGTPHPERGGQIYTFDSEAAGNAGRSATVGRGKPATIAVARDEAFCFVYEDNLRLLREAGGGIVEFSPLRDERLPEGCSGIYLPGGYPEFFADALSENIAMGTAVREAIAAGMPVYAECGGFIYLTRGIRADIPEGDVQSARSEELSTGEVQAPLLGIFPVATRMLRRRKALGYREVEFSDETILGGRGTVARGHEFHYSEVEEMPAAVERAYRLRRRGTDLGPEGYRFRNCLASYVHLHFGSCPGLAPAFVASCKRYGKQKTVRAPKKR